MNQNSSTIRCNAFIPPLFVRFLFLILSAILCSSCSGGSKSVRANGSLSASRLATEIESIAEDSLLAGAMAGIDIETVEPPTIIYRRNATTLFHPASNMKLLTTGTAVRLLGPAYTTSTVASADTIGQSGVLSSNLFITGSGDPLLDTTSLDSIASLLAQSGIRTISGNLVGDVHLFDELWWGSGWMWDDEPSTDAPFLTPLTVCGNAVTIHVSPGPHTGDSVRWSMEPYSPLIHVNNTAMT
jgi:D-alanyl-D-alanine carboxypeptidase/D-alanyl-D-alanine-endopeptidase (penicillin-binding protein 4)